MLETINHVNREISQELGISEEEVRKVNSYFWKEVKECIRSLDHTAIRVRGFGTFMISRVKLYNQIYKLIKEIRRLKTIDKEFKKKTREEYLEERYFKLRQYLDRRNELAILYYTKKQDKIKRKTKQNNDK